MAYLQWRRVSRLLARPQTAPVKARWRHGELWTPKGHPSTLQIHRVAEPWHTEVRVRERCGACRRCAGAASTHCQALPRHQAGLKPNVMGSLPRRGEAVTADAGLRRRRQAKRSASHQPREASFNPILYEKGAQCHQNFAGVMMQWTPIYVFARKTPTDSSLRSWLWDATSAPSQ